MKYAILCRVSGGVTGTRTALLKGKDGAVQGFDTETEAVETAADLNMRRGSNGMAPTRASFTYSVIKWGATHQHLEGDLS